MSRLGIKQKDDAQIVVENLYGDIERRILSSPPGQCPVDMASSFLKLSHAQTCGKCVTCRVGLGQLLNLIEEVLDLSQDIDMDILDLIEKTAKAIKVSSDCAIGAEAATMVLRGLYGFRDDYEEHILHHRCSERVKEMREPVPCVAMCPSGVDVPGYSALIKIGAYDDAVKLIRKDNPFPTVCALICEHPCESRCRRNLIDAPVNIRGLKRYAVDNAKNYERPEIMDDTGKKVAIIGGGPSGLSAAYFLAIMGHKPTVYEMRAQLGGMLRYGIPNYRLPRERLQEDINVILNTGVETVMEFDVNNKDNLKKIIDEYDAVYISIGSHTHKEIGIDGEYLEGVVPAVEMLRGIGDDAMPDFADKAVCVIGGGNVAMDVARTAKRLGAREVKIVYRRRRDDMTALRDEIDGAIAEGCNLFELKAPSKIEGTNHGKVCGLWVKPQIAGESDKSGRPKPSNADLPLELIQCDIVISAIGQGTDYRIFENHSIPINRGNIEAMASGKISSLTGVYAGGDCVTGPSTVINAVAAGKVAAANIDEFLGFNHEIKANVTIPQADISDNKATGRVELKLRYADERGLDFLEIEKGMTEEEAKQEASRCLRCDYNGFGAFRGGRKDKW